MKFARYWIPLVLGIALGGILSWRAAGTPMRDLLRASRTAPASGAAQAASAGDATPVRTAPGGTTLLLEDSRVSRLFAAMQESRALKRRSEFHLALRELGAGDMEALLLRIEALRGGGSAKEAANAVLERWFELDAKAAVSWIRSRPKVRSYWAFWAKLDPGSALREASENPRGPWMSELVNSGFSALAGDSPTKKGEFLLGLPKDDLREILLNRFISEWSAKEPEESLRYVRNLPADANRSSMLAVALGQWSVSDPLKAMKVIPELLGELPRDWRRSNLVTNVTAALAPTDPAGALAWLDSLPEEDRPSTAYVAVGRIWAAKEPIQALEWSLGKGLDPSSDYLDSYRAGQAVVAAAMRADGRATLEWIQAQPPGEQRDTLLERALSTPSSLINAPKPEQFVGALSGLAPDAQTRVAFNLGKTLGDSDSAKSAKLNIWLNQLPDPPVRQATIAGAGYTVAWSEDNPEQFLAQFSEPAERDAALRGMTKGYQADGERTQAATTAATIGDPATRQQALDGFVVDWLRSEPKAAEKWLNSAQGLSPEWVKAWRAEAGVQR
jgi:hypothetical protein